MSKHIACSTLNPGCAFEASAETEEALLEQVVAHAAHAHDIHEITPELAAEVKAAIRNR
jgi:predicted small metal-binding protein